MYSLHIHLWHYVQCEAAAGINTQHLENICYRHTNVILR